MAAWCAQKVGAESNCRTNSVNIGVDFVRIALRGDVGRTAMGHHMTRPAAAAPFQCFTAQRMSMRTQFVRTVASGLAYAGPV
jgi:hypothetical protein